MKNMGFWPEIRAYLLLLMFNATLILLIINYYTIITKKRVLLPDGNAWIYISALFLAFLNYFLILHNKKWKKDIEVFDKLPKGRNQIGSIIVWSIILGAVFALFLSFFLLYEIDY